MSKDRPVPYTQSSLENAALHYLERFDSSSANLRRVLLRKVSRAAGANDSPGDDALAMVEAVIAKLCGLGYVDDRRYANAKAHALRSRGSSARKVEAGLAAKGVGRDLIRQAMDSLDEPSEDGELKAAMTFARKRRLGPFRGQDRALNRQKDLAAMGRAGFDWSVAKQVIDSSE